MMPGSCKVGSDGGLQRSIHCMSIGPLLSLDSLALCRQVETNTSDSADKIDAKRQDHIITGLHIYLAQALYPAAHPATYTPVIIATNALKMGTSRLDVMHHF